MCSPPAGVLALPTSTIQLLERPAHPIAVIRHQVAAAALSRVVPESCGAVWRVLTSQGVRGGRNLALYRDDTIRLEAGVECADAFAEQDGVVRSMLPSGLVATATHAGPYGTLGATHDAMRRWLQGNGYRALGPRWELYGHWQSEWDSDPSRILTEVCYLVAPTIP
ncbi:MAG: GyrI-like domain-containing protein [Gemmatimonadaceae bacterium]